MDCNILLTALFCGLWTVTDSTNPVPHDDYVVVPPVVNRMCIEAHCRCGYEPNICDVEGGSATCDPCSPGTFQAEEISSRDINDARRCKPHNKCSSGW